MKKLYIQIIAVESEHETASGLQKLGNDLRTQLTCKVEPVRAVNIPEKGSGWVIDIEIERRGMTYQEIFKIIKKHKEPYNWYIE